MRCGSACSYADAAPCELLIVCYAFRSIEQACFTSSLNIACFIAPSTLFSNCGKTDSGIRAETRAICSRTGALHMPLRLELQVHTCAFPILQCSWQRALQSTQSKERGGPRRACTTAATDSSSRFNTAQRTERVRNPVCLSIVWLKLGSSYASMTMTSRLTR